MDRLKVFFFLIFLSIAADLSAQTDTLYQIGNSVERLTATALQQKLDLVKNNESAPEEWAAQFKVTQELQENNTLIQIGGIHLIPLEMLQGPPLMPDYLNQPMPSIELVDLYGKKFDLAAASGKVLFINFWFTRCPPCIVEMPYLNQLQEIYANQDVEFLSFAPEQGMEIERFLERFEFNFRHFPSALSLIKPFGSSYPKNILVDKNGIIRHIGGGIVRSAGAGIPLSEKHELTWEVVKEKLDLLINE